MSENACTSCRFAYWDAGQCGICKAEILIPKAIRLLDTVLFIRGEIWQDDPKLNCQCYKEKEE